MTLKPTEGICHSALLSGRSPFAFRIKFNSLAWQLRSFITWPWMFSSLIPTTLLLLLPDWLPPTLVPLHRLSAPLECPLVSPLSFCLVNSDSLFKAQAQCWTLLVQFSIKTFIWASQLLAPGPTTPPHLPLWETHWALFTQMSQYPRLHTGQAQSKYMFLNTWVMSLNWWLSTLRGTTTPTESGLLTGCPKQHKIQITTKCAKRPALHALRESAQRPNCMLSPTEDSKLNQKRRGAQPAPGEVRQRHEKSPVQAGTWPRVAITLYRKCLAAFTPLECSGTITGLTLQI